MKLEAKALLDILSVPCRVAGKRTTLPALNCILFGTSSGQLIATATDLDVWVERRMPVPNPSETLPYVCVNAQRLLNCIRSASGQISIDLKGHKLIVSGKGWTQSLGVLGEKEFPQRPAGMEVTCFTIDPVDLADAISTVAWCVDHDLAAKPWGRTVMVKASENSIRAEAFKRVLYTSYTRAAKCESCEFMVPGAQASLLCEAMLVADAKVNCSDKRLTVSNATGLVSALLPEDQWPDSDKITKSKAHPCGSVDSMALCDALRRITSIHSDDKVAKVNAEVADALRIHSQTQVDSCDETVALDNSPGGAQVFMCNAFLWLQAMERFEAGPVELRVNDVQLFMEQGTKTTILSLMKNL